MISLTASHFLAHLFCPRFTYFEHTLHIPERQERRFKVQKGRAAHEEKDKRHAGYLRKRLGVTQVRRNLYLGGEGLPFRGVVDEVLTFADGSMAPLDWKFAEYQGQIYKTYKLQSALYGWLIRQIYGVEVNRGFLVFIRSGNRLVEVPLAEADFDRLARLAEEMRRVLEYAWFPPATKHRRRCVDCTFRHLCPK